MQGTLQHRIRERAYEIWNAGGQLHGQAEQHWLAAEREILTHMSEQNCAEQPARRPVRQRRPVTNLRPQPKKVAKAG
jgi:Protein of unknown function (DUF2934)